MFETALCIIDVQDGFVSPYTDDGMGRLKIGACNLPQDIAAFKAQLPQHVEQIIVVTNNSCRDTQVFDLQSDQNYQQHLYTYNVHEDLLKTVQKNTYLTVKSSDSAADNPNFIPLLKKLNTKHATLCGLYSDACVLETAISLAMAGFTVDIMLDLCRDNVEGKENATARKAKLLNEMDPVRRKQRNRDLIPTEALTRITICNSSDVLDKLYESTVEKTSERAIRPQPQRAFALAD